MPVIHIAMCSQSYDWPDTAQDSCGPAVIETLTSISLSKISHSHAPDAIVPNNNLLSRLNAVRYASFHASMSCATDQQSVAQVCLEQVLQSLLNFIHDLEEGGMHVTQ